MAADKLNKHSKASNGIRHTSWEIQKVKKKNYTHYDLNTKSRISLDWDDTKERVVSKKEQISIAQRELAPFLPSAAHHNNVIGDVFAVPFELFELDNLTGLLSYEVWQTCLSVQEREFLTQFLPEGTEPHAVVHDLLAGNNIYFGSPFKKWGASICTGDYHPDAILRQEQRNKANKVAYYSELQEYHTKMIGSLQLWKERWTLCTHPENFMQKLIRPKMDFYKSGSSHEIGLQLGPQHDSRATSGSCSWDADDKSCNGDSLDLSASNGETLASASRTDLGNKYHHSSGGRSVARPKKGDKLRKLNIECGDGAKYMSYIKVSKEQHERVKSSMKHSSTSIQPRSLDLVLGNLDGICVQPYERFEEEERQKLHDHWLHLAKIDLPAGFENWKSYQFAKGQLTTSLRKELEDKWKSNDESVVNLDNNLDDKLIIDGQDEELEQSSKEHVDEETDDVLLIASEENMEQNDISIVQSEADMNEESHDTTNKSSQDSGQHHNFRPITVSTNTDVITNSNAFPSSLVDYPETINHTDTSVEQFHPPSTATEIWPLAPLPNVYSHQPTSVSQDYPSITQSSFLHRRSDGGDPFFNPYASQDRNELLLHSHYLGTSQFSRNISSSLPLDPRLNVQQNMYVDGREEHLLPLDQVQGWAVNSDVNLPMSAPSHHRPSQNWFSEDEVARDGWSGGVVPNQNIVSGGQVVDESLYSVLSECNGLRAGVQYGSTENIQSGNYVDAGREWVRPTTANGVPPQAAARGSGFNYMSGNEALSGWMNLPRARLWNDRNLG